MDMSKKNEKRSSAEIDKAECKDQPDAARREAMLKLAGYASCVAPAMLVLMSGQSHAKPKDCDNPAWTQGGGFSRAGHSGC